MKKFAVFFFFLPHFLFSQGIENLNFITLSGKGKDCSRSLMQQLVSKDKDFLWEDLEVKQVDFFIEEFLGFKKLLETQASQTRIFSGCECVQYSTNLGEHKINLRQKAVEIYEIKFKSIIQSEKLLNKINKAKIETIDWPDASIPVKFYVKEKSLFAFLDASDDHYEKEAAVWFNELVLRLIKKLDNM
jgi:hypothetical protein